MRKLSETFMENLQKGFLQKLMATVRADKDLDLHIRNNYLNIYYKGNSLLKLSEKNSNLYEVKIDNQFTGGDAIDHLTNNVSTDQFIERIPRLKANIAKVTSSLEIEYEQLIIRTNNRESRNNPDYYIVDRQYSVKRFKFDLLGFSHGKSLSGKNILKPCLIEIKFALNRDISDLPDQISRYYNVLQDEVIHYGQPTRRAAVLAEELQTMFFQKLELGMYNQPEPRLNALKKLTFANDIADFHFIIILVDYNPRSNLFNKEVIASLKQLNFNKQIKVLFTGFALWESNLKTIDTFRPIN